MREQILELRSQGKSYNEIVAIVGCTKGNVSYHCGKGVKKKYLERRNTSRRKFAKTLKIEAGGKCQLCGYKKCLDSLHFHHRDETEKSGDVSNLMRESGFGAARAEVEKCILVCANCHGEIHAGITTI